MFAYVNGFLEDVTVDNAVIDVNGFGINVRISADTASRLPGIGQKSAQRLAYHIAAMPQEQVKAVSREQLEVMYYYVCRIMFKGVERPNLKIGDILKLV